MLLPLGATAIVAAVLLWELASSHVRGSLPQLARAIAASWRARLATTPPSYDPGRELRAEQRARALLRSCVNEEQWAMYRDLGFLRVWGSGAPYAYLVYPHRPIVAYVPQTGTLLNEYCVAFPDETRPYGSARLPDADDVLAKWMALAADERRLIADANMHLPGRQIDPARVREDLTRLERWERERLARPRRAGEPTVEPVGHVERAEWADRVERVGQVERAVPCPAADVVIKNAKADSNSARLLKIATAPTPSAMQGSQGSSVKQGFSVRHGSPARHGSSAMQGSPAEPAALDSVRAG